MLHMSWLRSSGPQSLNSEGGRNGIRPGSEPRWGGPVDRSRRVQIHLRWPFSLPALLSLSLLPLSPRFLCSRHQDWGRWRRSEIGRWGTSRLGSLLAEGSSGGSILPGKSRFLLLSPLVHSPIFTFFIEKVARPITSWLFGHRLHSMPTLIFHFHVRNAKCEEISFLRNEAA